MQKILQTDIDLLETEGYCLIKSFISVDEIAPLQKFLELKQNCRFCLNKIPELKPYAKIMNIRKTNSELSFCGSLLLAQPGWPPPPGAGLGGLGLPFLALRAGPGRDRVAKKLHL